ncbi:MAG: lysylphosphatidylglycerol synthase transmembrane domain-containing protein [Bacteroidota bacterium]
MLKNIFKYVISLGIAIALLYWTLKDYDFAENYQKLKSANLYWILVSAIFTLIAHTSRAIRSKMLLEPLGYKPSTLNSTLAILMGYFANYLVPRLGEVTRCTTLTTTDNIPFEKTFGTVITERIIDFILLFVLLLLNFILEFDRLSDFFLGFFKDKFEGKLSSLTLPIIVIICILIGGVIIWKLQKEKILNSPLVKKIVQLGSGLLEGLTSIKNLKNPIAFIGHSVLIWTMYYLMAYCLFFALPETANLGLLAGLSTLVIGAIGIAAPTPGGLGTYHALVGGLMVLYGLSSDSGKTLAIFLHGSQMIITIIFGIISFLILFILKRNKLPQLND